MVTVKIDEDVLVEMLMDRLREFWKPTSVEEELYQEYYQGLVDNGALDGQEFDPSAIVDNDYVNYLNVIDKSEFNSYGIEDEDDDRILLSTEDYNGKKWFLIS